MAPMLINLSLEVPLLNIIYYRMQVYIA